MSKSVSNKLSIFISFVFFIFCLFIFEPESWLVKVGILALSTTFLVFFTAKEFEGKYVLSIDRIRESLLMTGKVEIPRSKTKTLLIFVMGVGFVILGMAMTIEPESFISVVAQNANIIRLVGIINTLFFGFCAIYAVIKLFDDTPGLTIFKDGIKDNSTAMNNVGFIDWADIEKIETQDIASVGYLIITTVNPSKYINQARNFVEKKFLKASYKMYGTPIMITSTSLMIKFDDLEQIIIEEFKKYKGEREAFKDKDEHRTPRAANSAKTE